MTIASSTTKPTDSVIASREMLSIEKPNRYMNAQAPISDTGSARAGISVAEPDFKKTKMTTTTSAIEISSVLCTSSIDWRIDTERSLSTCVSIDGGSCDW